jgi:hypothetical protein
MFQSPITNVDLLVANLYEYVQDLKRFRMVGDAAATRGRTQMIFNVINKLRDSKSDQVEDLILRALNEVELDFDISSQYENICWKCYRTEGFRSFLDSRVDQRCPHCNWLICPRCRSCKDVKHGGCPMSA